MNYEMFEVLRPGDYVKYDNEKWIVRTICFIKAGRLLNTLEIERIEKGKLLTKEISYTECEFEQRNS